MVTDALGRPVSMEMPDGSLLKYGYDRGGAPYSERVENLPVTGDDLDLVTETVYDAKGQKVKEVRGNGTTTIWEYDPFSFRVSRIKTTRSTQGDKVQDLIYVYDAVGNVTYRRDDALQTVFFNNGIAAPENCYSYDALYRLIKASGREHVGQNAPSSWNDGDRTGLPHKADETALQLYIEYYSYDAVGNPLEVRHTAGGPGQWTNYWTRTFAVSAGSNHMTGSTVGSTTESYGYDSRGNLISGLSHLPNGMGYNEASRLMAAGRSDSTWWYQYDGGGQRVRKSGQYGGSVYKQRIYVGGWERYADSNGIVRNSLKTGAAMIETRTAGTDDANNAAVNSRLAQIVRYQYGDHLGSSSLELDEDGAVISFEEYTPFGSTSFQSGRSSAEVKLKRYRYTGKERDEETGLNYHGARYYAPWLLRWMAVDPLESKYSPWSSYNYCFCNPVMLTDPSGEGPETHTPPKPERKGSQEGDLQSTSKTDRAHLHNSEVTHQENWYWHAGSGNHKSGWYSENEYYNEILKPVAKDYNLWMDGSGKGDLYFGFVYDEKRLGTGTQEVVHAVAKDLKENPSYDGLGRYVPIWGSAKQAQLDFQSGHSGWGTFNTAMAVGDVFLLKSLFGGVLKATWKKGLLEGTTKYFRIGLSKEYNASVSAWKSLGVDMSGYKHHWLVSQSLMKKYPWLKSIGNQTWNLTRFDSQAAHMRWGHFTAYPSLQLGKIPGARVLYPISSTPSWLKLGFVTHGGRTFAQKNGH
jgi:RHS repeat-associated protein